MLSPTRSTVPISDQTSPVDGAIAIGQAMRRRDGAPVGADAADVADRGDAIDALDRPIVLNRLDDIRLAGIGDDEEVVVGPNTRVILELALTVLLV